MFAVQGHTTYAICNRRYATYQATSGELEMTQFGAVSEVPRGASRVLAVVVVRMHGEHVYDSSCL